MIKYKNEALYQEAIKEYQTEKNVTVTYLSKKYGFDRGCFGRYMKRNNIEIDSKKLKNKENADRYDKAVKLYNKGCSINQIHKELGTNKKNFGLYLKSQNIEIRGGFTKQYANVNEEYFDVIDTPEKAYWLGFVYADGSVVKKGNTYRVTVELNAIDTLHLRKFLVSLESNIEIKKRKNKDMRSVTINRLHMVNTLIGYGCVPNKTEYGFVDLNLPEKLKRDFLRGYLDGDGYIEKTYKRHRIIYTVKSKLVLDYLLELLQEFNPRVEDCKTFYRIHIEQKEAFFNLLDYLYKDSSLYLDRKYRTYQDRIHAHLSATL